MAKYIFIPKLFEEKIRERGHERHMLLFEMLQARLGWELKYKPMFLGVPEDTEAVISYGWEFRADRDVVNLTSLNRNIKLICFLYDPTWITKNCVYDMFRRADLIISPLKEYFNNQNPDFKDKHFFLPNYFAPEERFTGLPYNENPKMKCLMSGQALRYYTIRVHIIETVMKHPEWRDKIDILEHKRFPKQFFTIPKRPYEEYGQVINEYFCSVTDSSHATHNSVVAKSLEIPAAGALLLTTKVSDRDEMGFVPYEHYIPITRKTALEQIKACLENPGDYEGIRKKGMEFVRGNHGLRSRFEQLKKAVGGLC